MNGSLSLANIPLSCLIGVYPHEHEVKQTLSLTINLILPLPSYDTLDHTIDYDAIVAQCREVAEQPFQLIESLAAALYSRLQECFSPQALSIRLTKHLQDFCATVEIPCPS